MKIFLLTTLALVAFAFNSILCRMALGPGEIDAASFTTIRLASGALTLIALVGLFSKTKTIVGAGHWAGAFFLFAYAVCFSFAYIGLTAGTGALILFGSVQLTMVTMSIVRGERPGILEWFGFAVAIGGLVYLVFPGLAAPPLASALLMAAAGAAWGAYTLLGRSSSDPLADTMGNFVRSVPMAVLVSVIFVSSMEISGKGVVLAVLSGALASGVGYTIWYSVLKHHTSTRAAVLQLSVPVLAAAGGIVLLAETANLRLLLASVLILGGIGLTIFGRRA